VVAIPSLESLRAGEHELVCVVTQPDRPAGRGRVLTPTPVANWATAHGIEILKPHSSEELIELATQVDVIITIGYGLLLPEALLNIPRYGFLNLHFSLLPAWRGAAPVQRSIEAGDLVTGVTVFKLDAGMDTGPIYVQHRYALDDDITSDELFVELADVGVGAIEETLQLIESGVKPTQQGTAGISRALKLSKDEGRIDWNQPSSVINRKIRAFTSNPGAWTEFRGQVIKVESPHPSTVTLKPGEILHENKKLFIGTSTEALEIRTLIPAGKQRMDATAWARGAHLAQGDHFE
jgi:methionyl-tRNA formyltransferase